MLYGTSKILQLLGPDQFRTGAARNFFLEFRTFEVTRAIIFNDRSFLSQPPWSDFGSNMWTNEYVLEWSPMERLLDIMLLISNLCARYVTPQLLLYCTDSED